MLSGFLLFFVANLASAKETFSKLQSDDIKIGSRGGEIVSSKQKIESVSGDN